MISLLASDVMTIDPVSVIETSVLEDAIRLMLDRKISGLPVVNAAGSVVGILTEGDLLRRAELGTATQRAGWLQFFRGPSGQARDYLGANSREVGDLMTIPALTADVSAPLSDVVALMQSKRIKQVPIVQGSRLVGIVSRSDLLKALAKALALAPAHRDGPFRDPDIQEAIMAELKIQPWAPVGGITVRVSDGVVDLDGVLLVEADRAAIRVLAQNVAGVTSVRDHMIWVEPNSGMSFAP